MPVKGERNFFKSTLSSIEAQGVDVEVVVQDGDVEPDSGQSDALNKGFAKANGEWLFWLNADDVLLPRALNRVFDVIERNKDTEWIAGDAVYIDKNGIISGVRCDAKWRPWFGNKLSVWTGGPR